MPKQEINDVEFIKNSDNWPRWPCLPVKRYPKDAMMESGFLIDDNTYTVYIGSIFRLKSNVDLGTQIKDMKQYKYKSAEEIVEDGWIVD